MNTNIQMTGNWKPKLLLMGTLIGAGIGLMTAQLMAKSVEEDGDLSIDASDILKTSLGVLTTMRSVASLGAPRA